MTTDISSMSQLSIVSEGTNLKLYLNGTEAVSVAQGANEAIYLYITDNATNFTVHYTKSMTAPPADDSTYVRWIPKTKNGGGGYNELSITGGKQGAVSIISAQDDVRWNETEKFNVDTRTYEVYLWYRTKTFGDGTTRDVAKVKITTPASSTAEADCNNLPHQSFCHCNGC